MRNRSTIEVMVLLLTATVCAILLIAGVGVAVIEITNPEQDTSRAVSSLFSLVSGILGALLGLLAGRGERLRGGASSEPPPPSSRSESPPPSA